jgi:uncharacterized SAM-binding protein YcdF (DUF218 family)
MSFLYSVSLNLLLPSSLCVLFLLASALFHARRGWRRFFFWLGVATLMVCGNEWVVRTLTFSLERQYLPPKPVPEANCIVILSGGIASQLPPRSTIEIAEAGDRVLYGGHLYREGKAPLVICTGGIATGGIRVRPGAEDMADLLEALSVPKRVILTETNSGNTYQHARNLGPLFQERGIKRVLLVTSAMHMPRSMSVFQRNCPGIEFTAAPTDYRVPDQIPMPWYRYLAYVIPTPGNLVLFSEVMHEYLGMGYYRVRGWM